jgi:hypothetical protein
MFNWRLVIERMISVGVQRRRLAEVAVVAQLTLVNGTVALQDGLGASVAYGLQRSLADFRCCR